MWENHLNRATMRVSMVARHLNVVVPPTDNRSVSSSAFVRALPCSNAAADGPRKESYHRVHGQVSSHPVDWRNIPGDDSGREFTDIVYEKAVGEGIAKITMNRPEMRNAFRPRTVKEMIWAFGDARDDTAIGVVILTGMGTKAFSSGGDQAVWRNDGYADAGDTGSLNVLDLQVAE